MNTLVKGTLLAGASALALGLASSQASAFQDVDWEWDTDINEKINIKITEHFKQLDPRGLVQVELLQISIGDIEAESVVRDIKNDPGFSNSTIVDFTASGYNKLDVEGIAAGKGKMKGYAKDYCWWGYHGKKCDYDPVKTAGRLKLPVDGTAYGEVVVYGQIEIPVLDQRPWDQLPTVESVATAIANVSTVEGNSAVFVHDGQFSMGDIGFEGHKLAMPASSGGDGAMGGGYWHYDPEDNEHVDLASILLVGAALGLVESADIEATSDVYNISNARVESTATAIANVHSIDVNAELPTDVMVIADLVQFSYGDITAESNVHDISIVGYGTNGGANPGLPGTIVSSVATAIGNVSSVTVTVDGIVDGGEAP